MYVYYIIFLRVVKGDETDIPLTYKIIIETQV